MNEIVHINYLVHGKNLINVCYFINACMHANSLQLSISISISNSLQSYGLQPASLLCPYDSPGKNTVVHCHDLLQEIFPTQGSNEPVSLTSPALAVGSLPLAPSGKPILLVFILIHWVIMKALG